MTNFFKDRQLLIASMHEKERVLQPLCETHLGVSCRVVEGFNTDVFGSFTGIPPRKESPKKTLKQKIETALDLFGYDLGIGSEGSFYPSPATPFATQNTETIMIIDRKNNISIDESFTTLKTNANQKKAYSLEEAFEFARQIGFPDHGIHIRPKKNASKIYHIVDEEMLKETVQHILSHWFQSSFWIETDMRAHKNPTRMVAIEEAMKSLLKKLSYHCPECRTPGFGVQEKKQGLPCSWCGKETVETRFEISQCVKCDHTKIYDKTNDGFYADPAQCEHCNP